MTDMRRFMSATERRNTFVLKYYKNETSKRASKMENYTQEELLEELHDEELHEEEPEEREYDPPPSPVNAKEIKVLIDTLTERLADLS
jgi:hypothetical protein